MPRDYEARTIEELKAALMKFPVCGNVGASMWRKDGNMVLRMFGEGSAVNVSIPLEPETSGPMDASPFTRS